MLPRAIHSVLRQTHRELELVVVDDASPDPGAARAIAESFADSRVRFVRRDVNGGPAAARNSGIRASTAALVTFLDDDDEHYPDCLATFLRSMMQAGESETFAWCRWDEASQGRAPKRMTWTPRIRPGESLFQATLRHPRVPTGAIAVHRALLERVGGFDEELRSAVDVDLFLRLARVATPVVVDEALLRIHGHAGPRVTDRGAVRAASLERILAKHSAEIEEDPLACAMWHHAIARHHAHGGDLSAARLHAFRAVVAQPRLKPLVYLGAMCGGGRAFRLAEGVVNAARRWARRLRST